MRVWSRTRPRLWWAGLLALWGASFPAQADEFVIRWARTRLVEHVYLLDAAVEYRFSSRALEALDNGVPLTIRFDITVERVRSWWLNSDVATLEQRYQLEYHAFSEQYLIRNLNSDAIYAYPSRDSALEALGTISDFPLLDENLIETGEDYLVELKVYLDIEALPSPLRPLAYITPAWRLGSDGYQWSLKR